MAIVAILGYGIFKENNLVYKSYLDKCLEVIKENQADKIILCGGFTNKKYPNISEASSMANYLVKEYPILKDKVILEEKSISTLENIRFVFEIIRDTNATPNKIIFCSDSMRIFKVFFMASSFAKELSQEKEIYSRLADEILSEKINFSDTIRLKFENLEFVGLNMQRKKEEIISQIPKTILGIAAMKYPDLEDRGNTHRKQKWGL